MPTDYDLVRANIQRAQFALTDAIEAIDALTATGEIPQRIDPRDENCRKHSITQDGKVNGIQLTIHAFPNAHVRLIYANLVDENEAQGQTVCRCRLINGAGQNVACRFVMAYPYHGNADHFEHTMGIAWDGGAKLAEHIITAKFIPPNLGPLALYVAGADDAQIASDVLASIGLPFARHISLDVTFQVVEIPA